jgi:chemotaxis protein methyltransferase CheR
MQNIGGVSLLKKDSGTAAGKTSARVTPLPDFKSRQSFGAIPTPSDRPWATSGNPSQPGAVKDAHVTVEAPKPAGVPEWERLFAAAGDLYHAGRYDEALLLLDTLISKKSGQNAGGQQGATAMALTARVYANRGQLQKARKWAEKAVAENKTDAGTRYLLAGVLLELGLTDAARKMLRAVLFLDPEFVPAHVTLGSLARREGDRPQRDRHFTTALALLRSMDECAIVPESDGMTAARLREVVESMLETELET